MALIHEQIPKIMGSVGAIGKDRKNVQQGYSFRGIDDVYNALNATMAEHGVFSVPDIIDVTREERPSKTGGVLVFTMIKVRYSFFASDGSSIEAIVLGEGMDSGDKSSNKAMSAAQKYAYLQVFSIPTVEPKDSEHDSPEPTPKTPHSTPTPAPVSNETPKPMSEPQRKMLFAKMKEAGLNNDEAKSLFNFVAPVTSKAASAFISDFDVALADWRKATAAEDMPEL